MGYQWTPSLLRSDRGLVRALAVAVVAATLGGCSSASQQFDFASSQAKFGEFEGQAAGNAGMCAVTESTLSFEVSATCYVDRSERVLVKDLGSGALACDWRSTPQRRIPNIPRDEYETVQVPECTVSPRRQIRIQMEGRCGEEFVSGAWNCVAVEPQ